MKPTIVSLHTHQLPSAGWTARWISRHDTVFYTSKPQPTEEKAKELAHAWLKKSPNYIQATKLTVASERQAFLRGEDVPAPASPQQPATPNAEIVRKLIEQSNAMIHTLMREPPCRRIEGGKSCIERETDADDGEQRKPPPGTSPGTRWGWNGYRQEKMCSTCAALWAVSVARNHLDDELRLELMIEAENERKAVRP